MMPFVESFEDVNNGRDDEKVDPTNVACERVLGVLKYTEKALPNLQFDLLAQHAMAKFNKVSDLLSSIDTAKLEEFHSEISAIEKKMKEDHLYQQENILDAARSVRDEVLSQNLFYFLTKRIKAQLTDHQIKQAASHILENRDLLPKPDFSNRTKNLKILNSSLKEHFGERFVVLSCYFHLFLF